MLPYTEEYQGNLANVNKYTLYGFNLTIVRIACAVYSTWQLIVGKCLEGGRSCVTAALTVRARVGVLPLIIMFLAAVDHFQ